MTVTATVPHQVADQVSRAHRLIEHHLGTTTEAIHLFGSAVDGGLQRYSDLDLLVTVSTPPMEALRRALMTDLLTISAPPGSDGPWRPLEVTVIARNEVIPWRHPARRELQFGEWLRRDLMAGIFESATLDHDLAILLTKVRNHSIALAGPPAVTFFDPVPGKDFYQSLAETVAQWNEAADWEGDERNIVLALARIWYSASTGHIASKHVAAAWTLERLPVEHRFVLSEAHAAYLGLGEDRLASRGKAITDFIAYARSNIEAELSMPLSQARLA